MSHVLVLALFREREEAAGAAQALHAAGVERGDLSIVARTHDDEEALAKSLDGTPGAEIEDSRLGGLLGELGGYVVAAVAVGLPGVGSLVAGGPLAADLGEAVGHVTGRVTVALRKAGLSAEQASEWEAQVQSGAVLIGVHVRSLPLALVRQALDASRPVERLEANWPD